jgi:hypothetical protein
MKDQLSPTGCRIDVFLQGFEAYALFSKLGYGIDEEPEGPAKPIQPPNYERIPCS